MHKRKNPQLKEDISPNLIPMIDIMFLLLLFFMLGADMGKREHEEVLLPLADKVKEDDNQRSLDPETTINIHHNIDVTCAVHENGGVCREDDHWKWAISGQSYNKEDLAAELKILAELEPEAATDAKGGKQLSRRKALIRADRTAPYGHVQKVIELCGLAGIYKIQVGAAKPSAK